MKGLGEVICDPTADVGSENKTPANFEASRFSKNPELNAIFFATVNYSILLYGIKEYV